MTKKKRASVKVHPLAPNLPPFQWMPEHQESFDKLKEVLTSAPVLSYPDYSKPFLLETDSSLKGLGAALLQEDNEGNLHVVSFASCTLKPYEKSMKNYSSAKTQITCTQVVCVQKVQGLSYWFQVHCVNLIIIL